MKVSLGWLGEYVPIALPAETIAERLTLAGIEVAAIQRLGTTWENIYVARIERVEAHPNADRLRLVTVDFGGATQTVVTGAPNVAAGQKVAFARTGARLIDGHDPGRGLVTLKPTRLRGIESAGMVCSELELGLGDEHAGILVLGEDARVGQPLAEALGDTILTLEVTTNRGDCLSMLGVAREVAAIERAAVTPPPADYPTGGAPVDARVRVEIEAPDLCARYTATIVDGLRVGPSPRWLADRLTRAGIRPINNVVDVTNYVMLEWGQPLHAFDYDRIGGQRIVVRRARPGERLATLDGQERPLEPEMLVIADAERPVALAGVMGGADSEVTAGTTRVLIESATFHPISIRRTARALKLPSEASRRFERGLAPELAPIALARATRLMREVAGGEVAPGVADAYPAPRPTTTIRLEPAEVARILGQTYTTEQMAADLALLGYTSRPADGALEVSVPIQRVDVSIPADLAEEIARINGYDTLPTSIPGGAIPPLQPPGLREMEEAARDALVGCGLTEMIAYALTSPARLARLRAGRSGPEADGDAAELLGRIGPIDAVPLSLVNPLSSETSVLRTSAFPHALETLRDNLRALDRDVRLFEIGRVYLPRAADLPIERHVLTLGTGAFRSGPGWGSRIELDFFDLKGWLEELFRRLGLAGWSFRPVAHPLFHPGRAALISTRVDGAALDVGVAGEVAAAVRGAFDIGQRAYLAGLDLERLFEAERVPVRYTPLPRYPAIVQDVALVLDAAVAAERVEETIRAAGRPLLAEAALFDVYEGERLGAGQRGLAYRLSYQADRTLTDREVADVHRRIEEALRSALGARIRGQDVA